MEDGRRQPCVDAGQGLEELGKVLDFPRAAGGDDGDGDGVADRVQHLQVKAALHAVGVDGVHDDLAGPQVHAFLDPGDGLHAGVVPAAAAEDAELAVHALDVSGEDHALAAIPQGGLADEVGVADGPGVDADLVGPAFQHPVEIVQGVDAAAHGEGDEDPAGRLPQDVGEEAPALGGGGDVVENQLVRTALGVVFGQFDGGADVVQSLEVDPLDHPAVLHVQAGDDAFCDHWLAPSPKATAWARSMAPV